MKRLLTCLFAVVCLIGFLLISGFNETESSKTYASHRHNLDRGGNFRVINLSPDSPPFDFCRNGRPFATLFYWETSGYRRVSETSNVFDRSFAGHGCNEDLILNRVPFPGLPAGVAVSAAAISSFFFTGGPDALVGPPALVMFDETERAPNRKARLRCVNVTVDGPDFVDFLLSDDLVCEDVEAIRENTVLILPSSTPIPYHEVDKGRQRLTAVDSDTGDVLSSTRVNFKNRSNNTVYLAGIDGAEGDFGLDLYVIRDGKDDRQNKFGDD